MTPNMPQGKPENLFKSRPSNAEQQTIGFSEAKAPVRRGVVAVFVELVQACERRDVKETIEVKQALHKLGFRCEQILRAGKGGGA